MTGASRKPTRVLMLLENFAAPPDNRTWPEALALREAGYEVSIICPKLHDRYRASHECIEGIQVYRYAQPSGASAFAHLAEYTVALVKIFWLSLVVRVRHGFDVIHAGNPPDFLFLIALVYRPFGVKFVFDQHDLAPQLFWALFGGKRASWRSRALRQLFDWLERWSYRTASLVLVTNESFARHAMRRGGCPAHKVAVVRNASRLRPSDNAPPDLPAALRRGFLLAYVGEMAPQDGIENALYALDHLVRVRGRHDVRLLLIGDGSHAGRLRLLAHKLALDDFVHFTGWVTRDILAGYLQVADVGVVPDPANGLSEFSTLVKTMDYMAMGVPVVAFDLAETRFTAQDAALYAEPNDVEDLAARIELLLDDPALRQRMGALGKARVESALSWDRSRDHLLSAYGRLLDGHTLAQGVELSD